MFDNLDGRIKNEGYLLDKKDDFGLTYKKVIHIWNEKKSKIVDIKHNKISFYTIDEIFANKTEPARLTYKELMLFSKKFKKIKKEYRWK